MSVSLTLLKKVRCRFLDTKTGQPVAGVAASLSIPVSIPVGDGVYKTQMPISTLCSDATGYMSFDLATLTDLGIDMAEDLIITAPRAGLKEHSLLQQHDAPNEGGNAPDNETANEAAKQERRLFLANLGHGVQPQKPICICIEFPVYVEKTTVVDKDLDCGQQTMRLPSVQSPDICDYSLSPHSFVTPKKINVGNGCCELLAPSTMPVQEHSFYKVLARTELEGNGDGSHITTAKIDGIEITGIPRGHAKAIKLAEVLEYVQRWYSIGHSLGEIKYSLALAPGEATQLAVIDWTRQDIASRVDNVRDTEYLNHDLNRERGIEESIDAGLRESQSGWSWMGGLSTGAAYDAGPYGKYTGNAAMGASVSNTSASRSTDAESAQALHDHIVQGTSFVRSLTSTVIVTATQAEQNALQTRRIANHNHCHSVTMEYYEVLRHFRVETTFQRRRKAVLIPFNPFEFTWEIALRFRTILEGMLLDQKLVSCFDAIVRFHLSPSVYEPKTQPLPTPAPVVDTYYSGTMALSVSANSVTDPQLQIEKNSTISVSAAGQGMKFGSRDIGAGFGPQGEDSLADHLFPKEGAHRYALLAQVGGDFTEVGSGKTFTAANGGPLKFQFNDWKLDDNSGSSAITLTVTRPEALPNSPIADPLPPEKLEFDKASDELAKQRLLSHLNGNLGFYNRAIWMLMDATERRLFLEANLGIDSEVLSWMDDIAIAVSGNYVAFPYNGPYPNWSDEMAHDQKDAFESIVTLPTRGVFAEAQIGHCNSCEKRDVTRMWDWTQMTTEEPPAISGVTPGPKGQIPTLTPAALPTNVISITQPPAAPNPTGLATALTVLGKRDIFRDMSGLNEVSTLLGELADGTTKTLGEMIQTAAQAKDKVDAIRSNNTATGANDTGGPSAADVADRFSLVPEIKTFAKDIGLDEDQTKQFALDQIYGTKPSQGSSPSTTSTLKPKAGQVSILVKVVDAWGNPAEADFEVELFDEAAGDLGKLRGRHSARQLSDLDRGLLQPLKGATKGILNLGIHMLSESYSNFTSEVVDLQKIDVPYNFPAGTTVARFTAQQEFDVIPVTVEIGETLEDKAGSAMSGTVGVGASIKIVEASLSGTYGRNWETVAGKTHTEARTYQLKVPKAELDVKQTAPRP